MISAKRDSTTSNMQLTVTAICLVGTLALVYAGEDPVITPVQAKLFLSKYGYSPRNPQGRNLMPDDISESVKKFQNFVGLSITGKLDEQTLEKMSAKRCGNSDITRINARKKRYALQGSRWKKSHLTYKFENYSPDLPAAAIEREMAEAFQWWADNSQLTFQKVEANEAADIVIKFAKRAHGDGNDFDGPGYTLAHAYFPIFGGDVHFDEGETWSLSSEPETTNLKLVAAHEFGHSLGLSHCFLKEALMTSFYNPDIKTLHQDDIQAIQHLYSKPVEKTSLSNTVGVCNGQFDAITQFKNGSTYAFLGSQFLRLNDNGKDEGYLKLTSKVWGITGKIDAALTYGTYTNIFQGNQVYRLVNAKLMDGFPKDISTEYSGIPSNIDAAFQWSGNGKLYFMKGNLYWRYNSRTQRANFGYPKSVSAVWSRLPKKIDAALQWNSKTYFFSDDMYYRFDDANMKVAKSKNKPYPRRVDEWWLGCKENALQQSNSGQQAPGDERGNGCGHANITVASKFLLSGFVSAVLLVYATFL